MISWQDSITKTTFDHQAFGSRQWYKFSLPRGIGVTNYLVEQANRLHNEGKRVLFVATKNEAIKEAQYKGLNSDIMTDSANSDRLISPAYRGRKFDWIIADNVSYGKSMSPFLIKLMEESSDHILWIDTVQGSNSFNEVW